MYRLKPLILTLLGFYCLDLKAQVRVLYTYQDLSHLYYARQRDSLKKAWECPSFYKKKETQKLFKEYWDSRTEFITSAIDGDNYVHDQDIYPYVDGLINQLVQANKQYLPVKPFLLIDRSPSVNAYSIGGNVIAVNLGLLKFVQSREELALVLAHELSHNILTHAENAMKQRAEWISSDEYKKSLNAVLDSKYERLSRLNKVLENYSFNRSRHQRYHESDADSLAIILLKRSNIAFQASFFMRLDSADLQYRQALKTPLKTFFTAYQLPFEEAWSQKRSKGLSTRAYNFSDDGPIEDSVKTHPDCADRYARTKALTVAGAKLTPLPAVIQDKAGKMLIWNLYQNMALTRCLYRIMLEKDRGVKDEWYDFMVNNIFLGLYLSDKDMHRFNAVGIVPKEYIAKDYYQLQTMLEQMPRESLEAYCKTLQSEPFWARVSPSEKAFKDLLYTLNTDPDGSDKHRSRLVKEFTNSNAVSMYCELPGSLDKK